jgi:hypothetical protein
MLMYVFYLFSLLRKLYIRKYVYKFEKFGAVFFIKSMDIIVGKFAIQQMVESYK